MAVGGDGKPVKLSGSLFFALPDGGAVLYQLEGEAEGPEASSGMELETPAKTALAFTVPVANWLRRTQRYDTESPSLMAGVLCLLLLLLVAVVVVVVATAAVAVVVVIGNSIMGWKSTPSTMIINDHGPNLPTP